jgi:chemotaxis family two-component system response regulator PixG
MMTSALSGLTQTPTMMTTAPQAHQLFCSQLQLLSQKQFTGRLDIETATGRQWSLYLSFGQLIWASGSVHPTRRLRRQLSHCLPQVNLKSVSPRDSDRFECWDYHILTILARRQVTATEEVLAVMRGIIAEVLFDVFQAIEIASVTQQLADCDRSQPSQDNNLAIPASFKLEAKLGVRPSSSDTGILPRSWTWEVGEALNAIQATWGHWSQLGLALYSPNLAPAIVKPEELKAETAPGVYKNLAALINQKRTLRDLAILLKQDLIVLTRSLLPYIRKQFISLIEVADLPNPFLQPATPPLNGVAVTDALKTPTARPTAPTSPNTRNLIACIDDSPPILAIARKAIESAGYEFLGIDDAVRALPLLLQHQPDAIFLDLVMPIANGYEICSQIRRVSQFKDIPVIILTGKDGIVDRMRAKMVGATDFINKPVEKQKLLEVLKKYCPLTAAK